MKHRLRIAHTPAALAEGHEAGEECERLREACVGGRLDEPELARLRRGSWLGCESWRRGGYFTTSGLRANADHPELVMMNVPGAFAPWAQDLLNEIGDYVLESGKSLASGEIFLLADSRFPEMALTFALIEPGELPSLGFAEEMLLVVPMP